MKTILVAVDFSPASIQAARYAAGMAKIIHGNIILLHVNVPQESFNQSPVVEQAEIALDAANDHLLKIREDIILSTGGSVEVGTELKVGEFFTEMFNLCDTINPYLVIMGSQGNSEAEMFLMGSNSIHAMRNLHRPLLTVPLGTEFTGIRTIGLASDFDKSIDNLPIEKIREFVVDFGATLHIINIGNSKEVNAETVFESAMMQEMLRSLNPQFYVVAKPGVEEGIIEFTETNDIDVLIVFPRQYGFINQIFHKSISRQLILHSKVPVMVLHTEPFE